MRTLIAIAFMASSIWAQIPQQGPPPKNLSVRPDGHVSANQDPSNPEQFEVHVVKPGETLSGIAGVVLKNPRLWPQLWEQNEHIINPHWIYPDDKILIQPVTVLSEARPPESEPPAQAPEPAPRRTLLPPTGPAPLQAAEPPRVPPILIIDEQRPVAQIKFNDLYCSGFVRTERLPEDLKVLSKFDQTTSVLATETEYVYLSKGSEDGITVGSMYQVVRPTKALTNPNGRTKNDRNLGMHYLDIAQLRVVLAQADFSLARVMHACEDAVDPGDMLMPFQPIAVPEPPRGRAFNALMSASGGATGSIVSSKDVMLNFGSSFKASGQIPGIRGGHLGPMERGVASEGTIVYIDIGQDSAVRPGDLFIVYRNVEGNQNGRNLPREASRLNEFRTAIGEIVVLKVGERAATALVTYSNDALTLGDTVERR